MLKLAMKVMPYLMWLGFLLNTIFLSLIYQVPCMTFLFFTGIGLTKYIIMYTTSETNCPSTVAIAKPSYSHCRKRYYMPNIIKGSKYYVDLQNHIILNIETFILPTGKYFSNEIQLRILLRM